MPRFARRPSALASIFASVSLLLVPACSSSDDSNTTPSDTDAGTVDENDAGESDDVVVRYANRWGHADGTIVEKANPYGTNSPTIVATVDGKEVTFQPTVRDDGAFVFTGVPRAPYVLESRFRYTTAPAHDPGSFARYPIDGRRNVEHGDGYWGRPDATQMTDDTKLALTLQVPEGIADGDTFSWMGLHSYFFRSGTFYEGEEEGIANAPAAGATSCANWTFDGAVLAMPYGVDASGLPSAAANDDLLIVQSRSGQKPQPIDDSDPLARFAPWKTVNDSVIIGMLQVASPDFANGKTNTVSGTLEAPKTESITVDFHGGTFDVIREAINAPDETTRSTARVTMSQEAGAGPAVYTSVAPESWTIAASAQLRPVDLSCFPNPTSTACDPDACAIGCENARRGFIHPGELLKYTFEAPRVYETGMRDFYTVSYSYRTQVTLHDGTVRFLTGGATNAFPKTTTTPSFSLELGPPSTITIDGNATAWDDTIASIPDDHAPVLEFTPATKGSPEYHRVDVIDLTPDLGKDVEAPRTSVTVASFYTYEPSVTVPKERLRSSHTYYVRVAAVRDGWQFGEHPPRTATYQTSIYTAPFVFGTAPAAPEE